jgi:hypothetical protein
MQAPENIPDHLAPAAQAALLWINNARASEYSLTGLVDADDIETVGEPFEFGLVLCDGEICAREQVRVVPDGDAFHFDFVEESEPDIPPLLDPPVGVRREWLDRQLEQHEFVLLLFYRGLW